MSNVIVKKAGKKNKGVFSLKNFKENEVVLEIKGKIINREQMLASSRYIQDHIYTIGRNKYLIASYPDKYINHSCNPNVYEKNMKVLAMRNIKKGEELCFDYSINSVDDWWMRCYCGSRNCRKIVKGNFFILPLNLQKKYLEYIDDWFKKEFEERIKEISRNKDE